MFLFFFIMLHFSYKYFKTENVFFCVCVCAVLCIHYEECFEVNSGLNSL